MAVTVALLVSQAFAQKVDWRFWKASDGFPESYVRSVTAEPDGSILVRHGAVDSMTVLDGYGTHHLPEIAGGRLENWGVTARAYKAPDGDIWTVDRGQLRRFRSGTWLLEAPRDLAHPMLAAVPAGGGRILVLFSDRLAAYSPGGKTWSILKPVAETCLGKFSHMVPGFFSDFWITGEAGVARVKFSPDGAVVWTQSDIRRLGLQYAINPKPGPGQEVYIATSVSGGGGAVACWDAAGLKIVYTGHQNSPTGWRGPDGELWVADGSSLLRLESGRPPSKLDRGEVSGTLLDVLPMPDGSFWLATSDGLARCCPSVWRTPGPVAEVDAPVHAIAEDRQGRLWFAASENLLELDGVVWRRHPLPPGIVTHPPQTRSLVALTGGHIAVKVGTAGEAHRLLLFHPESGRFETVVHPQGRSVAVAVARSDGTFWVRTEPGRHIEIYDGKTFRPQFDLPAGWEGYETRTIMQTAGGAVWIGGPSGAAVRENGVFRELRTMEGFAGNDAFDMMELGRDQVIAGCRDKLQHFDGRRWWTWRSGMDRARMAARTRDGTLWVASGSGLFRLQNGNWLDNGVDEGLPSAAINTVFQDSRGRVWVGTNRGLSLYHPEADREAPEVGFRPGDNSRQAGPDGHLRVVFSGVDKWKHTPSDKLLFSYRLDGGPWSPFSESPSAAFDGLKAGGHSVLVLGMDRDGNASQPGSPFTFRVALPWYRQTGFFAIVIASGLMVAGLLWLAVSNHRERSRFIAELKNARMAAESASRHKGQFLANMSHEIRTPMNGIIGMTEIALELATTDEQRSHLTTVQRVANSLLALLNDILDFSKVEAGKLELVTVDFALKDTVQDALRTLEVQARAKGLTLALAMDPGVPRWVSGDDRRLAQIVLNLAGNAIKFSANSEVRIDILPVSRSGDRVELEFVVSDHGIGIPLDKQQTIFAAFEQADGSTTRKYGGTGLGLAICTKLAELMHGRMWVESPWRRRETGAMVQGSAFHFRVTLSMGKAPAEKQAMAAPAAIGNLRILLAEDNLVNQKVAVHLLERYGHTVLVANDGREAFEIAKRETVDIVLMDVQMPGMDGFQATAAIREWERDSGGHLPIVALTAHAMDGDRERCLAHGFDSYLSKPFRPADLQAVLAEAASAPGLASPGTLAG
jgi:signal transduction histidine kinase/CheY-like chemotaxis protein/ligand-binding sensor domain-containing protein